MKLAKDKERYEETEKGKKIREWREVKVQPDIETKTHVCIFCYF